MTVANVVHGTCETRFDEVLAEFERNFAQRGEVGASVHVMVDGQSVVDLWGGVADPEIDKPWAQDTVAHVWSCGGDAEGLLLSEDAFGHCGIGGSIGFADPRAKIAFGYVMNQQGSGLGIDERGQSLVDAVYRALGHHRSHGGGDWFPA